MKLCKRYDDSNKRRLKERWGGLCRKTEIGYTERGGVQCLNP